MKALALVAALLPALALGDASDLLPIRTIHPNARGNRLGRVLQVPFAATGCNAAITGSLGQASTFARTSSGLLADATGCSFSQSRVGSSGVLLEEEGSNLLTRTEELNDGTAWSAVGHTLPTITADNVAAPDGTTTADRLVFPNTTNSRAMQVTTQDAASNTFANSVWLRADGATTIQWDLSASNTGAVCGGGSLQTLNVTTSWQRFTSVCAYSGQAAGNKHRFGLFNPNTEAQKTIYAWGAQAELRPVVTSYMPARNLFLRSQELDNASWNRVNIKAFGSGSTANAIAAPNGTTTAELITENGTATSNYDMRQNVTLPASTVVVASCYFKAGTSGTRTGEIFFSNNAFATGVGGVVDLTNGTTSPVNGTAAAVSRGSEALANGWYRLWVAATTDADGGTGEMRIGMCNGTNCGHTGDNTSNIYVWGCQIETGRTTPSPYFATAGTMAVSRAIDALYTSSSLPKAPFSIAFDYTPFSTLASGANNALFHSTPDDSTEVNASFLYVNSSLELSLHTCNASEVCSDTTSSALTWTGGTTYRIALNVAANGTVSVTRNGTSVLSGSGKEVPAGTPAYLCLGSFDCVSGPDGAAGGYIDNLCVSRKVGGCY